MRNQATVREGTMVSHSICRRRMSRRGRTLGWSATFIKRDQDDHNRCVLFENRSAIAFYFELRLKQTYDGQPRLIEYLQTDGGCIDGIFTFLQCLTIYFVRPI